MAYDKFVVVEDGVVKELTAAEYSSSRGFVGVLPSAREGYTFGGRYSENAVSASGDVGLGIWDARSFVSQSRGSNT